MEEAAQSERDLQSRVGAELKAMGHSDVDIIPESLKNFVLGEGPESHTRVTPGGRWKGLIARLRNLKK